MLFGNIYQKSKEEYWNIITHLLGLVISVVAMIYLLLTIREQANDFKFVSIIIFCLSSIVVYGASCLYHYNAFTSYKKTLRILDHISIFYLIAGSYTPFLLITFPDAAGWKMMKIIWGLALLGTLFKLFFTGKYHNLSLVFYVLMGWVVLLDFDTFIQTTPNPTMYLIMLGGAFYMIGVVFYRMHQIRYNHVIWHLFVVAANVCHLCAVVSIL